VITVQVSEKRISVLSKIKVIPFKQKRLIHGYRESYSNGVEKFGVWWTVFQLSLWSFALIFLFTAVLVFVVYLPKAEMLDWELI
jgi:ABC-type multidrug transport system permease subunit